MAKTPEGIVQTYAQEQLKAKGCLVRKIGYESRRGCPDLIVMIPGGRIVFLEMKKDEKTKADPHQAREHKRMQAVGVDVRVIGSKEQADKLIEELWS